MMPSRTRVKYTGPNPPRAKHQPTNSRATVPGERWRARVKCMGVELFLGNHDTWEEAKAEEDAWWEHRREMQRKQSCVVSP